MARPTRRPALLGAPFVVLATACGGNGPQTPTPSPPTGCPGALPQINLLATAAVLQAVHAAISCANGYTVTVSGHNLVLPQWGGIDTAKVDVGAQGQVATADVLRTGDGPYFVVFVGGATYFKRSTCDHFTRIPGGGADVLAPFLWSRSDTFQGGAEGDVATRSSDGTLRVGAQVGHVGPVTLTVDPSTARPLQLTGKAQVGTTTTWLFGGWGTTPKISAPTGSIAERGPGGNPC
jgi:hypothetical protein